MKRPTRIELLTDKAHVTASITPDGEDWRIIVQPAGDTVPSYLYRSVTDRPDNGALWVSQTVREVFGITGTYQTTQWSDE